MVGVIASIGLFIMIGFLSCLYGKKLLSIFLSVAAFALTFEVLQQNFSGDYTVIFALIAALVAALLPQYAKRTAFFLIGFIAGAFLGVLIRNIFPQPSLLLNLGIIVVTAIVFGILCSHWSDMFIRIATGFIGGRLIGIGMLFLIVRYEVLESYANADPVRAMLNTTDAMTGSFLDEYSMWILIFSLVFAVVGYFFQTKRK